MASALQATLSDDKGRWILSSHQEAQSELAISTLTDNKPETLILDRTFVDEENVRWIIDYKSSVPQEENLDAFLSRMKITYAPQLNRYAKAMAEMDGRPIKTALYFPVLGHLEVCQSHAKQAIQL